MYLDLAVLDMCDLTVQRARHMYISIVVRLVWCESCLKWIRYNMMKDSESWKLYMMLCKDIQYAIYSCLINIRYKAHAIYSQVKTASQFKHSNSCSHGSAVSFGYYLNKITIKNYIGLTYKPKKKRKKKKEWNKNAQLTTHPLIHPLHIH